MRVPGTGLARPRLRKPHQPPPGGKTQGTKIAGRPTVVVTSTCMSQMTRHHICLGYPGQLHGTSQRPRYRLLIGRNMPRPLTAPVRPTRLLRVEKGEPTTSTMIHGLIMIEVLLQHTLRGLSRQNGPHKRMQLWNRRDKKLSIRLCMRGRIAQAVRQCPPCLCISYTLSHPS